MLSRYGHIRLRGVSGAAAAAVEELLLLRKTTRINPNL